MKRLQVCHLLLMNLVTCSNSLKQQTTRQAVVCRKHWSSKTCILTAHWHRWVALYCGKCSETVLYNTKGFFKTLKISGRSRYLLPHSLSGAAKSPSLPLVGADFLRESGATPLANSLPSCLTLMFAKPAAACLKDIPVSRIAYGGLLFFPYSGQRKEAKERHHLLMDILLRCSIDLTSVM